MDKFTVKMEPLYTKYNRTFLSFFIWEGRVYPVGATVTLTLAGKINLKGGACDHVTLEAHYFEDDQEHWVFYYHQKYQIPFRIWRDTADFNKFNTAIENVDAEPIATDCQEYIDYLEAYKNSYNDKYLNKQEHKEFRDKVCKGVPPKAAIPERFKGKTLDELKLTPTYTDWDCPGIITGWILFVIFIFGVGIFKDWYIQLILRVYAVWYFTCWRQKKLWGF